MDGSDDNSPGWVKVKGLEPSPESCSWETIQNPLIYDYSTAQGAGVQPSPV